MKFEVEHPDFKAQRIVVETPGIFRKAKLLVNGSAAIKTKDNYLLHSGECQTSCRLSHAANG